MKTQQQIDQENNLKTASSIMTMFKKIQTVKMQTFDDKIHDLTKQDLDSKLTRREIADLMVDLDEMQENMVYELNQIKDQLLRSLI